MTEPRFKKIRLDAELNEIGAKRRNKVQGFEKVDKVKGLKFCYFLIYKCYRHLNQDPHLLAPLTSSWITHLVIQFTRCTRQYTRTNFSNEPL